MSHILKHHDPTLEYIFATDGEIRPAKTPENLTVYQGSLDECYDCKSRSTHFVLDIVKNERLFACTACYDKFVGKYDATVKLVRSEVNNKARQHNDYDDAESSDDEDVKFPTLQSYHTYMIADACNTSNVVYLISVAEILTQGSLESGCEEYDETDTLVDGIYEKNGVEYQIRAPDAVC